MDETASQAKAAAERACIIISSDKYLSVANIASVDPDVCKGCGSCSTVCPSGAMEQLGYSEEKTLDMVNFSLVNL